MRRTAPTLPERSLREVEEVDFVVVEVEETTTRVVVERNYEAWELGRKTVRDFRDG